MKARKMIVVILVTLVLLYAGLVVIEGIRLYNGKPGTMPLITLGEKETETRLTYQGPGYSVSYYLSGEATVISPDRVGTALSVCGGEFRVFGLLIWAWIE